MSKVVQDDAHCFGAPRLDGSGVPVSAFVGRFIAGDSVAELAADYEVTVHDVEECLRWALQTRRRGIK